MKKYISKFHYVTQDLPGNSHTQQVQMACAAGANWIQYRCLNKPEAELSGEINDIAGICDDWGATLILTNYYNLLNSVDAQGVYIEGADADLTSIRQAIGDDKTLGARATNIAGLLKIQKLDIVDYCGYGPFAHADIKPDTSPVLGYNGYRELDKISVQIPVIAFGSIQLKDVEHLLQTGIYGVAVSSAINLSLDPAGMTKAFYRKIY